jgi:hypothetical protein
MCGVLLTASIGVSMRWPPVSAGESILASHGVRAGKAMIATLQNSLTPPV